MTRPQYEVDAVLVLVPATTAAGEVLGLSQFRHLTLELPRHLLPGLNG